MPSPDSPRTCHCWGGRNVEKSGVEIRGNSEPDAVDIHWTFHESAARRLEGWLKRVHQWNETGVMIGPVSKLLDDSHGGQGTIGGRRGGVERRRRSEETSWGVTSMATGWGHETRPWIPLKSISPDDPSQASSRIPVRLFSSARF